VANDGQEAVNAVKESNYDAVLMDIQMPVMDGYTATRRIRKWEEKLIAQSSKLEAVKELKAHSSKQRAEKKLKAHSSKLKDESRKGAQGSPEKMPSDFTGQAKLNGEDSEELSAYSLQLSARAKRVPIIAMTAHAMAGDEAKSLEAGMDDHVTKPINPDKLFATLQKWIQPAAERAESPKPQPLDLTSKPEQPSPAADDLPEFLPGFNLGAGLKRLGGNQRLYRKLLLDFGANYGEAAGQIREALAAGDFDQAHSLVHNLKGLAGNLEATDLQAAAVGMEKLVKGQTAKTTSDTELNRIFTKLKKAINQALEAVQTIGPPAEEKSIDLSTDWLAEVPVEQVKEITDKIKAAADMGDVMQIGSIAEELKSGTPSMAPFCDKLVRLAEDFDFDGIKKIVIELDS
jgi:CheY-like chemotaxis protein